jgi:hypothetical protein
VRASLSKLAFVVFIASAAVFVGCAGSRHPSDEELEQRLKTHAAEFNRLVAMLFEDSDVVRLVDDRVFFSEGATRKKISDKRLIEYRQLFKAVGLEAGFHRDSADSVRLIASSEGLFVPTSEKSYVYSKGEVSPLVDSLDRVIERDRGDQSPVFRKLGGGWYLYYESW